MNRFISKLYSANRNDRGGETVEKLGLLLLIGLPICLGLLYFGTDLMKNFKGKADEVTDNQDGVYNEIYQGKN